MILGESYPRGSKSDRYLDARSTVRLIFSYFQITSMGI